MPRSNPVAHLFAHLNDATALRSNELVTQFFEDLTQQGDGLALRRIRAAVERALDAMTAPRGCSPTVHETRGATIIRRSEFERVPHKEVAADLGIGMRHFFRELGAARAKFAHRFRSESEIQRVRSEGVFDVFEAELQQIRSLGYSCRYEEASRRAKDVAESVSTTDQRIETLFLLANSYAEAGNVPAVESLKRSMWALDMSDATLSRDVVNACLAMAQSRAYLVPGYTGKARALCTPRVFAKVDPLAGEKERGHWAFALVQAASQGVFWGENEDAEKRVRLAEDLNASLRGGMSPVVRIRTHACTAEILLSSGSISEAKVLVHKAHSIAIEHNVPSHIAETMLLYAAAEQLDGNSEAAITIAREGLKAYEKLSPPETPWIISVAAHIEATVGDPREAIRLLRRARAFGDLGNERTAFGHTIEADCLVKIRRYQEASRAVDTALTMFRTFDFPRLLGFTLRVAAQVEEALGDRYAMREHISESVRLLEQFGHPVSLAQALTLSARMTGNTAHARRAKEILAAG